MEKSGSGHSMEEPVASPSSSPKPSRATENREPGVEVTVTLHKRWEKLVLDLEVWKKLLDGCIAAWEESISTEEKLRELEEEHINWGPPAENQDILTQFQELQVNPKCCCILMYVK